MVQMKAPKRLASQAGLKRSHVKTESRLHCQRQQQQQYARRSRVGGCDDIKTQSSPAASPTTTTTTMPNYMKPTISSNARKENLQVTTTIHSRPAATDEKKCSRKTRDSALNKQQQQQQQYYYSSKATCSSTMKDSKFPKALDLIAGGTEAEGSSVTKVCPYAYCSLNGHHHRPPLPPLKRFVSARRKSLKTQKSMELEEEEEEEEEDPSPFQVKGAGKDKKKETASDDFFFFVFDIYSSMQQNEQSEIAIKTEDETETPDVLRYEDDADQNSEPSDEEEMYEKNFLEYVECCDQRVEEEVHVPSKIKEEEEEEGCERVPTVEEVEESSLLPDNRSECSEQSDEGFGLPTPYCEEEEEVPEDDVVAASSPSSAFSLDPIADNAYAGNEANAELRREVDGGVAERIDAVGLHDGSADEGGDLCRSSKGDYYDLHRNWGFVDSASEEPEEDAETESTLNAQEVQVLVVNQLTEEGDGTSSLSVAQHSNSDSCDNFAEPEQAAADGDHIQTKPEMQDFKCNGEVEDTSNTPDVQNCDEMKARMRIVRKKMTTEEREEMKEFNPRGPRFLAVEPDPEAEKVDLRHQMMDEKKNSEEWMIDYALRQALLKVAPAPKMKVSLLVQAFESVTPLNDWEKAATSGFGHARIIQACN